MQKWTGSLYQKNEGVVVSAFKVIVTFLMHLCNFIVNIGACYSNDPFAVSSESLVTLPLNQLSFSADVT